MACNGFNHQKDCTCHFGGGHPLSRPPRWTGWRPRSIRRLLKKANAKCPECRAEVYYLPFRNGGGAYFDKLGPPWPKHPCTDDTKRYSPYTKSGKPRLTVKPTEFEETGWLPFILRNVEFFSVGTIIHGVALDNPTVLHFGTRNVNLDLDRQRPIHFRCREDGSKRVDINYFRNSEDQPVSICMFADCVNEVEILANCS